MTLPSPSEADGKRVLNSLIPNSLLRYSHKPKPQGWMVVEGFVILDGSYKVAAGLITLAIEVY